VFRLSPCSLFANPILSMVLFLAAVPLSAQNVKVDYDKSVDFSKFKTYAWVKGLPFADYLLDLNILGIVDHELAAQGLTQVDPNIADLLVAYHIAATADVSVSSLHDPTYAHNGGIAPLGETMWTTPSTVGSVGRLIKKGSLGVEMVDREKKQLVWAGVATGKAKEKRTDKMKQLDKVLTKMMDQYPPPRATK